MESSSEKTKASSLRWRILRKALLRRSCHQTEEGFVMDINRITRKTRHGFNMIPCHIVDNREERDAVVCYTLPTDGAPKLFLTQRADNHAELSDFEICNRFKVDNTGLVCHWPSEDVLAYFCLSRADMFRSKKIIELGSGYGLSGLVIAATTEALEVIVSDGNPQVVDYIQHNIDANLEAFGGTRVKAMKLHWNEDEISSISNTFDVIIASDCTFFKDFHKDLARMVKFLLKDIESSEAIFLSPRRGNSLDKFLEEIKEYNMHFSIIENYDLEVWKRHQGFMNGDESWPSYAKDHCYPLLVRIKL